MVRRERRSGRHRQPGRRGGRRAPDLLAGQGTPPRGRDQVGELAPPCPFLVQVRLGRDRVTRASRQSGNIRCSGDRLVQPIGEHRIAAVRHDTAQQTRGRLVLVVPGFRSPGALDRELSAFGDRHSVAPETDRGTALAARHFQLIDRIREEQCGLRRRQRRRREQPRQGDATTTRPDRDTAGRCRPGIGRRTASRMEPRYCFDHPAPRNAMPPASAATGPKWVAAEHESGFCRTPLRCAAH